MFTFNVGICDCFDNIFIKLRTFRTYKNNVTHLFIFYDKEISVTGDSTHTHTNTLQVMNRARLN